MPLRTRPYRVVKGLVKRLPFTEKRQSLGSDQPAGELNPDIVGEIGIAGIRYSSSAAETLEVDTKALPTLEGKCWFRVTGRDAETLTRIREEWGIHRLIIEDVANLGQRPKVEFYEDQVAVFLKIPVDDGDSPAQQLCIVLKEDDVFSFAEVDDSLLEPIFMRLSEGRGKIRERSSSYLLYAIVDAVIDAYHPLVARIANDGVTLEELSTGDQHKFHDAYVELRGRIFAVKRLLKPTVDAINELKRTTSPLVDSVSKNFLNDAHDHALTYLENVEDVREVATSVVEFEMNRLSFELNEVMRILTIFSTVFIPLGFLAGLWGMNFDQGSPYNMPELKLAFGYPVALSLMALLAVTLLAYYRRKGWI